MAYALGYDPEDYRSDDDEDATQPTSARASAHGWQDGKPLPTPLEMDNLDTATLEKFEWMEPLGYRALSEITGLPTATLRRHFWASRLKASSPEFEDISYYFTNSYSQFHGPQNIQLKRVINLKRFNENNCDYKDPNVQLLWHGTSVANVASILTNGFRLPMHNGMFGRGVYFADRVSKSLGYCRGGNVLFLCAVNLGRMYESNGAMGNLTSPPPGYDSVKGCGRNVPDPNYVRYHRGAKIPCGRTVSGAGYGGGLGHNEFIVYDLSKIAILFLVEF